MYGSHSNRSKIGKPVHLAPIFSTYRTNNGSNVEFILILILKSSDIQKIIVKFHLLTE
jgi:hypothetical protein